jgi:hypothetical protein
MAMYLLNWIVSENLIVESTLVIQDRNLDIKFIGNQF